MTHARLHLHNTLQRIAQKIQRALFDLVGLCISWHVLTNATERRMRRILMENYLELVVLQEGFHFIIGALPTNIVRIPIFHKQFLTVAGDKNKRSRT